MKQEVIIKGFVQLGKLMVSLGEGLDWKDFNLGVTKEEYEQMQLVVNRQIAYNGWFTKENVQQSLFALGMQLTEEQLTEWAGTNSFTEKPKSVALIMAGNIPAVGFHDLACVLLSGNKVLIKLFKNNDNL